MLNCRVNGEMMVGERLIAVAVDKDRASQHALKWAIDHIVDRSETILLVHVNQRTPSSPTAANDDLLIKREPDNQTMELFLPFRCYCVRRQVTCEVIALEDRDVAKALIEFVLQYGIDTLLLGAATRNSFSKIFKGTDVPSTVSKWAPEFCNVYVISKAKVTSIRASSRRAPFLSTAERMPFTPHNLNDETWPMSPFFRSRDTNNRSPDELSGSNAGISFLSPERMSTDSSFLSFYDKFGLELAGQPSEGLELEHNNFEPVCSDSKSVDPDSSSELSSNLEDVRRISCLQSQLEDVDNKMKRLNQELKQITDMYHAVSKDAHAAKQKARELHSRKVEEEQRLKEAQLAEEAALAIAEKEKAKCKAALEAAEAAKCKAALEAAEAAQKIAKLEAQKSKDAEMKAAKEAEEKKKVLDALGHSNMVLKYQSLFHILAMLFLIYFNFIEVKFFG